MNVNKKTQVITNLASEYHVEPDGSIWEQVFWHNNPADTNNLFKSTDTFSTGAYHNENAWFNFNVCQGLTSWEFLAIEKATINSSVTKYRWMQSVNPMTSTSTGTVTVVSGYTSCRGLCRCSGCTYLAHTNSTSDWWGAVGSWTSHQSGIPAIGNVVVTSGYCAVFVRVDPKVKLYKGVNSMVFNEINEI